MVVMLYSITLLLPNCGGCSCGLVTSAVFTFDCLNPKWCC